MAEETKTVIEAPRKRIICVDDVQVMLLSIKSRLSAEYEVFMAQTALKLFELLGKMTPDLIILDIDMPDASGYDIIKRLKKEERLAHIPIMFLTGKNDRDSVKMAFSLGADDILFKPVNDKVLMDRVADQLSPAVREETRPIILAVDDSPSILKAVNATLNDLYKVYTLPNPAALTEILKRLTPDLFILDCNMPKLSGFDLIKIIRNTAHHKETPIVFLTSEMDKDTVAAAMGFGVSDYIGKPINEEILRQKIAAQLVDCKKRRIMRYLE